MNRRVVCALLAGIAIRAEAQGGRPRSGYGTEPDYWVGLSYGYVEGVSINDGDSNSSWQFGYTSQIRATIEKTLQRGITVGAAAGFSNAPLNYQSNDFSGPCGVSCLANADVTQYTAFLRGGGGAGFHGMYTLEGGVTQFSKFRERSTGDDLPPASSKNDFTFGFGGGLGYGFSATSDFYVGEQLDLILHPQGGTTAATAAPRMLTFRVGFRVGF